ncbi:MAG: hypothetical protein LRZ84_08870 [Desertifilum sp.]|nr:hypothetical protein [Desertifilum sp.]
MNFPSFPSALLKHFPSSLAGLVLVTCLSACDTVTTTQYEATALTTYTWQVEYATSLSSSKSSRFENFTSTSLLNRNGIQPEMAVTGPDDRGLWWPALPPRPTVDEVEAKTQANEMARTPELIKSVYYEISFQANNQTQTLPTNYEVYREVVKAYPNQIPLELVLGLNNQSVEKAEPQ